MTFINPIVRESGVNISDVNLKAVAGVGKGFVSFLPGHITPDGV